LVQPTTTVTTTIKPRCSRRARCLAQAIDVDRELDRLALPLKKDGERFVVVHTEDGTCQYRVGGTGCGLPEAKTTA
jgi:hypothetical protein